MKKVVILLGCIAQIPLYAQTKDSILTGNIERITIMGQRGVDLRKESKPLSSLDEYMENSGKIRMIKRGNYAWEPVLNNMTTERTSVTIDGMKIFNACTDKMDPVTSYVEISNLNQIAISSGLEGGPHGGNNIGGNIDLQLNKTGFSDRKWNSSLVTGYESNGNYHSNGGNVSYSSSRFYTNFGIFHRKSENYSAGNHQEVDFSQFEKWNAYANLGVDLKKSRTLEGSFIYDDASNVGYPALPMDVKSARAWIGSLTYKKEKISDLISLWETKVYFNDITHVMDDTKRPNIAIHMDMPGWSKTYGFYSKIKGNKGRHSFMVNWEGYYNQSLAEMTMYPADPSEKAMFMYTWPDVRTFNTGLYLEDEYFINENNSIYISSRISAQKESLQSDFGLKSLQIFYPDMNKDKERFLIKGSAYYRYSKDGWYVSAGGGYGERAPSVSEAYGFYLFNSFDAYDYIGNPGIKKERSLETSLILKMKKQSFDISLDANYFYFPDYIIGKIDSSLSSMTIGANGVKLYMNIHDVSLFNTNFQFNYRFLNYFEWNNRISYSLGKDKQKNTIPLTAPLMYTSQLTFKKSDFISEVRINGAGKKNEYSPEYGEGKTSDYLIYNAALGYGFKWDNTRLTFKIGIENIFDRWYSTYADWNHIPRKGRNYFVNVLLNL
ncbi:TonB-dependent receptor [Chryseobacterium sp.]|uniref:TonB-dependent receptor plug domain-containing protein n=1 Tax=Chryseobacterium sp. TaxID=1871047 RepID=UPI0025BC8CD6|nr:TonB-dependent receptor [Chryseobacterium sp.]